MPISTVPSARFRTHSWLLVYFKSAGTLLMMVLPFYSQENGTSADERLAGAHERRFHRARGQKLAANVDLHARDGARWNACESNRALKGRRKCAARDLTRAATGHDDLLMAAQHAPLF